MIIYKATNKVNGKVYIGQTNKSFNIRVGQHKTESSINRNNMVICKAIRKYGFENFEWEIICKCENQEELNEKEKYYIAFYNSYKNGYNSNLGGGGNKGFKMPEKAKKTISIKLQGESNGMYGKPSPRRGVEVSLETRRKQSEAHKGKPTYTPTKETLKKRSLAQQGEKGSSARLTEADVLKIRELYATGKYYQKQLAETFGIVRQSVSDIITRKTWKHI
ncbi:GIY-YIG nuclease family protein [Bacillus paranthracis]|uniref:GIY-YIG nuclease family protein n=1 Tax=Bacillus paranthracis TaxID=2026186 RepID=UPI002D79AAC6|nr:GIY-YIG nuclease family protein [Bacillus paranthracis]